MAVICLGGIGKQMKNYNKKSKKKKEKNWLILLLQWYNGLEKF